MLTIRSLKLSDFRKLHTAYSRMGSQKHFIDLYWLGYRLKSAKWLIAQVGLFGSTIPFFRSIFYFLYYRAVTVSVVASDNGKIVGHCFVILREKDGSGCYIGEYGIWVTEEYRGKGLGKKLTESVLQSVKNLRNVSGVKLFVWANNLNAINLYNSFGFQEINRHIDDKSIDGVRFDSIEMYLNLERDFADKKSSALFVASGIDDTSPGIAGGETRFIEIARGWASQGIDIHLLSTRGGYELVSRFGLKVTPHYVKKNNVAGRLGFFLKFFTSFLLPRELFILKPSIVYSTNEQLYDVFPALLLKLIYRKKIKWGVVVHWLPPYRWWIRKQSTFMNSLLFLISERLSLYLACIFSDSILAVSDSTERQIAEDFFARFYLNKVRSVKCGVNFQEMREVADSVQIKKYEGVFLKRLQAVKGIFDLIDIWELVIKKEPSAKLIIIGAGVDGEEAKKRVLDRKLSDNIIFKGAIFDFHEKVTELSSAKLFILPTYEENWAISMGEAMACGVPVLAYKLKELDEVWGDCYLPIPFGDREMFATRILDALENPQVGKNLSEKATNLVKSYDWKLISSEELKIIQSLPEKRGKK